MHNKMRCAKRPCSESLQRTYVSATKLAALHKHKLSPGPMPVCTRRQKEQAAAFVVTRFLRTLLKVSNTIVAGEGNSKGKQLQCPISFQTLFARCAMQVVNSEMVAYYDPPALYQWFIKGNFRCPLSQRELNRAEVLRCAKMQSQLPVAQRLFCAYALEMYDSRLQTQARAAAERRRLAEAIASMQAAFAVALDCLRRRTGANIAFSYWLVAFTEVRAISVQCACHEAFLHMQTFAHQWHLRQKQHEQEYGRNMSSVATAIENMLRLTAEHVVTPGQTHECLARFLTAEYKRQARVRARRLRDRARRVRPPPLQVVDLTGDDAITMAH